METTNKKNTTTSNIEGNQNLQNLKGDAIQVENVRIEDVRYVFGRTWDQFWDMMPLADDTPIILIKKGNTILAGHYQFYKAKLSGKEEIPAIYIDDLQDISLEKIKSQFKVEKLALSVAYNIYASISEAEDLISFADFCKKTDSVFRKDKINERIAEYIGYLYYIIGVPENEVR